MVKNSTVKERILYFIENQSIKKEDFFRNIDISYSNFKGTNLKSDIGADKLVKILTYYPILNCDWLLLGQGEMLKKAEQNISNANSSNNMNNNINGNNGSIKISQNDLSNLIENCHELQKDLTESLKNSQNQVNTLLEILKNK